MDIIELVWLCFDVGSYTHEVAIELLTHPDIHQYIPVIDTTTEVHVQPFCNNLYTLLIDNN